MNSNLDYHLTYCTNIHPGESWEQVFESLKEYVLPIKNNLCPNDPFGIGLRLSNKASIVLLKEKNLEVFKIWLENNGLYVFTINGFPYGGFHDEVVKDKVHKPDWTKTERVDYTLRLCTILAELLPEGIDGGISTSPLSYKLWFNDNEYLLENTFEKGTSHFLQVVDAMYQIKLKTGKILHLDMEPEPDGLIENTAETVDFFNRWLIPMGIVYFDTVHSIPAKEAAEIIKTHFQICYDICHFAVAYENPGNVFEIFLKEGIKIGKIQISAALKADLNKGRKAISEELSLFAESTYLHQVIERDMYNNLNHYTDLPMAINSINNPDAREWRTHFHVPLFISNYGLLDSTQDEILKVLAILKDTKITNHLEIETYTWEVLPDKLKVGLQDSIEREIQWVIDQHNLM